MACFFAASEFVAAMPASYPWEMSRRPRSARHEAGNLDRRQWCSGRYSMQRTFASRSVAQEETARMKRKDHEALLGRIASETERKCENSRATTPLERAITWALRGATDASHVGAILGDLEVSLPVLSSVIQKLGVEGHPCAAHAIVNWMIARPVANEEDRPNVYIYNSLLGALKANRRYNVMDQVISEIEKRKVVPDVVTFNTVIKMQEEQGNLHEALNVFIALKLAGIKPTFVTYRMLFRILAKVGDAVTALEMFVDLRNEQMQSQLTHPESYHALQSGQVDSRTVGLRMERQWQQLEIFMKDLCSERIWIWLAEGIEASEIGKLFAGMEAASVELDTATCVNLLWRCGTRELDHVLVKRLYLVLRTKGYPLTISLCNHVIKALGKGKKWWAALQVFEQMVEQGPEPDRTTREIVVSHFRILLNAARRRRIWKWSLTLLDRMLEKGLDPGRFAWNAALIACAKANATSAAVSLFQKMIQHGEKPDVLSYGALLCTFEKAGQYENAVRLWAHMKKVGVKPNDVAYTIMICVHGNSGLYEDCLKVVSEMQEAGLKPSLITYNALITACAKVGNSQGALYWVNQMSGAWIAPDGITFEQVFEAFSADAKWQHPAASAFSIRNTYSKDEKYVGSTTSWNSWVEAESSRLGM